MISIWRRIIITIKTNNSPSYIQWIHPLAKFNKYTPIRTHSIKGLKSASFHACWLRFFAQSEKRYIPETGEPAPPSAITQAIPESYEHITLRSEFHLFSPFHIFTYIQNLLTQDWTWVGSSTLQWPYTHTKIIFIENERYIKAAFITQIKMRKSQYTLFWIIIILLHQLQIVTFSIMFPFKKHDLYIRFNQNEEIMLVLYKYTIAYV